jgi:hypothetical protein
MKPSDIITESIERREIEEAPMGFWKSIGNRLGGINPFSDQRAIYQGNLEIGKLANKLANDYRRYLSTINDRSPKVNDLIKWMKHNNLITTGVENLIMKKASTSVKSEPVKSEPTIAADTSTKPISPIDNLEVFGKQRVKPGTNPLKMNVSSPSPKISKSASKNTISNFDRNAAYKQAEMNRKKRRSTKPISPIDNLEVFGKQRVKPGTNPLRMNVSSPSQVALSEATQSLNMNSTLTLKQVDELILKAVEDTKNAEYYQNQDQSEINQSSSTQPSTTQQSDSSEPAPQQSVATSAQQSASSEPAPQQSVATSAQQSASSEPAPQQSVATSAQSKDELNYILRLSGIVQNHENRIKKLEAGKTDNRVKFTGKKTGT